MTTDDDTSLLESFAVSLITTLPAVVWWQGYIGYETTTIVYAVLITRTLAAGFTELIE